MKKEIWKFDVELGNFELTMPRGAEILAFQTQRDIPRIWVLLDWDYAGNNATETRKFTIQGTGMKFDFEKGKYIGTIQRQGGNFVWHLFEILE